VLVGAGTLRASRGSGWTGSGAFPAATAEFAGQRQKLGLHSNPTTLVMTASGEVDLSHPGLSDPSVPVVVAGPDLALERLAGATLPAHVRLEKIGPDRPVGQEILAVARRLGARLVLSEAGPHLAGQLIASGAVDELFLTLSPQLAGRGPAARRLSLIEGTALWPDSPRWLRLLSARQAGDHLFLRYRFEETSDGR
jgi:riboflavin biosynthesis pyrimidine reductase